MTTPEKPRFPRIFLKKDSLKRVRRGHRWIFSNEIGKRDPEVANGGEVAVMDDTGAFLGCAVYSAHALIAARLYANHPVAFDAALIRERLQAAEELRWRILPGGDAFRLAYGDSDGLPGIVVDRYGDVLVLQLLTASADIRREVIVEILRELFSPRAIVERSDSAARAYEQLPNVTGVLHGVVEGPFTIDHHGVEIEVDVLKGQKTGLYLDQAHNWTWAEKFSSANNVLDLFSHHGGWSLFAGRGGAKTVTAVDESDFALSALRRAWSVNGFSEGALRTIPRDVFQFLREDSNLYEFIVCDPPAFAKNRQSVPGALRGYRDVNRLAMKRLAPGGVLVSCSCSHNVSAEDFLHSLRLAARDAGRNFLLLPLLGQPPDHPPLLGVPETEYLKAFVLKDG